MANELQTKLDAILNDKNTNLLPENLKAGVTCLGVEGNLREGGADIPVKLFETVEEMQTDMNPGEGDLALVYRNEISNATVDSKFQTATFPDTVVLDNAITDYVEVRYRAVDSSKMFECWSSLDSSRFTMDCWSDTGSIRIEYESSDGITYTRTDTTGNPVDFGTEIYYEYSEMWNDAVGKFIQVGGSTFEGIFKYEKNNVDKNGIKFIPLTELNPAIDLDNNMIINTSIGNERTDSYNPNTIMEILSNYSELDGMLSNNNCYIYLDKNNNLATCQIKIKNTSGDISAYGSASKIFVNSSDVTQFLGIGIYWGGISDANRYELEKYIINLTDKTITLDTSVTPITKYLNTNGISTPTALCIFIDDSITVPVHITDATIDTGCINSVTDTNEKTYYQDSNNNQNDTKYPSCYVLYDAYLQAPTQLTLGDASQLLPGKIAYGKNGVVTGDGSIYTQISNFDLFQSQGMDLLNNYTILATNTTIDKLGDVDTLGTVACEYKKFDKPEELAEYDIHRIQNDTKYLAIKDGLEYRLYDLNFNLLDTLTFTEKQTIASLDSFMQNTSDLLLYKTTLTATTHYRWIRITDKFEKIDYSLVGGTSVHVFAYHIFNDTLYLAFDNGGSYMYIYKLTTSGTTRQLYKTSKAINYVYQGFANFCEYENNLYCSLVCNYGSNEYANDVVKITSSGSTTAVYSGAYNEPMVVTVNGYAVSKNGTYRVTDFTTPVSTVSKTYSKYSNYTPYYDEVHDAIIDYDYLYIGVSGNTFRRDDTLRTVITGTASTPASSLITDISNYEVMTILNIPMEDGTKLSFDMTVYLNKGESDKGYKLINLLNLDTSGRKNLYLGCINTL